MHTHVWKIQYSENKYQMTPWQDSDHKREEIRTSPTWSW
jgi:hypothetical protein